ncbi:hypothetical protein HOLleu_25813 [Holothuria leucospilota]|uniref:Uncharacterized protein n=1 Tax=Holothuria leucospilota TaxID=206669 RepID=A0A9Q1BTE8_HOLLE|nr:hypothetical protein HOLleu_25813 [Holothuria leucospilota]
MVVLSWIKGDPSKYKTFVGNRVGEIHQLVDPSCWNHCPGKDNPADLITRGAYAHRVITSKHWFEGPDWFQESEGTEREETVLASASHTQSVKEMKMKTAVPTSQQDGQVGNPFDVNRWGALAKAVIVVSFVLSGKNVTPGSSIAKLTPFVGKYDLLREKGRLQTSDLSYDEKHLIILLKDYFSLLLIRSYHLKLKNAGVESLISHLRNRYFIVGVRRLTKSGKGTVYHVSDEMRCHAI